MAVKKWEQIPLFDLDPPPVPEVQGDGPDLDSEPALFELDDAATPESDADVMDAHAPIAEDGVDAEPEGESETGESVDADRQGAGSTSPVSSVADTETVVPQDDPTADVEPGPTPASERGATEPAALPPASESADGHAVIVTAAGTYTPSGHTLTGPVDSIEKLDKLIRWATLTPLGAPAQIWIVGIEACEMLGWIIDPGSEDDVDDMEILRTRAAEELTAILHATLTPMLTAGWELRGEPGHVVHLSRTTGNFTSMVDIFIEPYVWTYWNKDFGWGNRVGDMGILGSPTAGTYLPDDDLPAAQELGRRLAWCAQHLGVLPGPTPARTGAAIVDKIKRDRTRSGKGIVVTVGGPVPPLDGEPRGDLEPAVGWTRIPGSEELSDATQLVSIDQRAAYLASAGMLELGYGKPRHLRGENALDAARQSKTPFGLWHVTLPPGDILALPPTLPLPHPHMLADQPVQTWITTVSLDALQTSIADGGIGAELADPRHHRSMGLPRTRSGPRQVGENLERSPQSCRRHRRHSNETVHRLLLQRLHRPNGQPRHVDRQTNATPPPTALASSDHRALPLARSPRRDAHRARNRPMATAHGHRLLGLPPAPGHRHRRPTVTH